MLYMNIYRVFVLLFLAICISDPKYYGKTAARKAVWEPSHYPYQPLVSLKCMSFLWDHDNNKLVERIGIKSPRGVSALTKDAP